VALAGRVEAIEGYLAPDQDGRALEFLRRVWPAPFTAVLRVRQALPWAEKLESNWTAAFRVPAHPRLRLLLARLGTPLLSTSVNRTGQEPLRSLEAIARAFGGAPDVWMFRDRGLEARPSLGSTLADCSLWPPRLLRPGRVALEALLAAGDGWREGAS
jgi:L-threonylcarbamoyladenylate synthase